MEKIAIKSNDKEECKNIIDKLESLGFIKLQKPTVGQLIYMYYIPLLDIIVSPLCLEMHYPQYEPINGDSFLSDTYKTKIITSEGAREHKDIYNGQPISPVEHPKYKSEVELLLWSNHELEELNKDLIEMNRNIIKKRFAMEDRYLRTVIINLLIGLAMGIIFSEVFRVIIH